MGSNRPPAPEPTWCRMDLRGELSTRYAWGYISPDDSVLVNDEGVVYVRVDASLLEHDKVRSLSILRIKGALRAVLKRALRWSKIVRELYLVECDPTSSDEEKGQPMHRSSLTLRRR
jgi:hypothetical protein